MKKRIWLPGILFLVVLAVVTAGTTWSYLADTATQTNNTMVVKTGWYDLNWHFRIPITLHNTYGSTVSNYQVKITGLNTSTLISTSPPKMNANGDDIRFTTSDGVTPINNYWIESMSDAKNNNNAVIWVKVPAVPNGDSVVYLYYGYGYTLDTPAAPLTPTPLSNVNNLSFTFFDDMDSATPTNWPEIQDVAGNGSRSRTTLSGQHGSYCLLVNDSASGTYGIYNAGFGSLNNFSIEYNFYYKSAAPLGQWEMRVHNDTTYNLDDGTRAAIRTRLNNTSPYYLQTNSSGATWDPHDGSSLNTWYTFTISNIRCGTGDYNLYRNGSLMTNGGDCGFRNTESSLTQLVFQSAGTSQSDFYLDLVKVWPYYPVVVQSIGSEE